MKASIVVCAMVALAAGPEQRSSQSARQKGRLFPPVDLGLLEAPDRDEWQKPDQIMDALRVAEGSTVADVGAAGGWFTMQLARRVGPNGIVYAEDIQLQMVEGIARRALRENLPWVRPILGTATDPRLPAGIDAILIADVYHEVEDPVALLSNAARSLKPQGLIGVVDFLPGGGGPGPAPDERPDPKAVIQAARAAGLQLNKREDIPPFLFLLLFSRATSAAVPAGEEWHSLGTRRSEQPSRARTSRAGL
jgi:ubiquinone/menaquinone biosynthesis C-methylase UbiE